MVERSCSFNTPRVEAMDVRIALYEQKELVKRFQEELEAEREAAASSASEALAMILQLQVEKATLAMEARQYKGIVEERMSHAEITLTLLEDVIHQKEVEITALESQVQAYRSKLQSLGCSDLPGVDVKLQERDDLMSFGQTALDLSVPVVGSQTPSREPVLDLSVPVEKGVIEQSLVSRRHSDNSLSLHGDLGSYREQIKKLDERAKEITDFRDSLKDRYKKLKHGSLTMSKPDKREKDEDYASSSSHVQDIFRVPLSKEKAKETCRADLPETMVSKQKRLEKKPSRQLRDKSVKRDHARGSCSSNDAEYQAEMQRLRERIERLESERTAKAAESSGVKQEEDMCLLSLQEAMLCFWL